MREIKFRALTKPCSLSASMGMKPKWVYGTGIFKDPQNTWLYSHNDAFCMAHDMATHIIEPETVGQYTGLKEKNGTEIYEGDIIECYMWGDEDRLSTLKVNHRNCFMFGNWTIIEFMDRFRLIKVIGNIHEEATK